MTAQTPTAPVTLGIWRDRTFEDIARRFAQRDDWDYVLDPETGEEREVLVAHDDGPDIAGCELLLAHYDIDGYDGSAFLLYRKDGVLYEVHGGHCSCYGLEGQWAPEETSITALRYRLDKGHLGQKEQWRWDTEDDDPLWDGEGEEPDRPHMVNLFADELRHILDQLETVDAHA